MGATASSGAESGCARAGVVPMGTRNHHWKWWHPFWLSTLAGLCSGFALGSDIALGDDLALDRDNARAERAARAPNHPTATAFHGCHRF